MKPAAMDRLNKKKAYQSDDDNIRYKINTKYFNGNSKASPTVKKDKVIDEDTDILYKFPTVLSKQKQEQKPKPKPKIKVNFWSNRQSTKRLHNSDTNKQSTNRRHTVSGSHPDKSNLRPKNTAIKVRKQVSFLPSPLFTENHVPMVTVPDDLTIQLNEEEANDLGEDFNEAFVNNQNDDENKDNSSHQKKKSRVSLPQTSSKSAKHKQNTDDFYSQGNENELEFFSKYVVQKLRKMETNQRIYSENLINTVLMLGQLSKLHGKSKITDA